MAYRATQVMGQGAPRGQTLARVQARQNAVQGQPSASFTVIAVKGGSKAAATQKALERVQREKEKERQLKVEEMKHGTGEREGGRAQHADQNHGKRRPI